MRDPWEVEGGARGNYRGTEGTGGTHRSDGGQAVSAGRLGGGRHNLQE